MKRTSPEERAFPSEPDAHGKVSLLLHTAVHRSHLAGRALSEEDHAQCSEAIMAALQILDALNSAIDPSAGELAQRLQYLYSYAGLRLIEGHEQKDPESIAEATRLLAQIASGWSAIPKEQRSAQALAA
ncbi:flagellar export chaperone FliS [Pseudomarimonas salicorniae]|uniref:Flagellar protein FliS n=1 Tax=Pseudomarimonas salicorniae TaxID=2933270 RepID=A0ABT0GLP6_9GAMM|nr:flagellar export chaperone FliS [Lysobacter sp. CAU 1642]MCK7595154.1 flagellar protein FliS [Lysobacter sp. CAU 1642]